MKQKLIMILGMQRSGTTALFNTLATSGIVAYQEAANSAIYDDFFLRPEPEIRHVLQAWAPGPVLLKPVRESERRGVLELIDEYADYDLQIVWLYRDPVNVLYSYHRMGWATQAAFGTLANEWVNRNQALLDALPKAAERVIVVRYEDLLKDGAAIHILAHRLGLTVCSTLEPDSRAGRGKLDIPVQSHIDSIAAATLELLDQNRTITSDLASQPELPVASSGIVKCCQEGWRWILRRASRQPADQRLGGATSQALEPGFEGSRAIGPFLNTAEFQLDPYGCFRRWRRIAPVHFLEWQDLWLVLNYDDVASMLNDSARLTGPDRHWYSNAADNSSEPNDVERHQFLCSFLNGACDQWWITNINTRIRSMLSSYSRQPEFDWIEFCYLISPVLFGDLFGVDASNAHTFFNKIDQWAPWDASNETSERPGLLRALIATGQWSQNEIEQFVFIGAGFRHVVSAFLGGALLVLLKQPTWMELVRAKPDQLPAVITELIRLTPPLPTVNRITCCDATVAGIGIPAGSRVCLAIGAANRDPARFDMPDELRPGRSGPAPLTFGVGNPSRPGLGEQVAWHIAEAVLRILITEYPPVLAIQSPLPEPVFIHTYSLALRCIRNLPVTFASARQTI